MKNQITKRNGPASTCNTGKNSGSQGKYGAIRRLRAPNGSIKWLVCIGELLLTLKYVSSQFFIQFSFDVKSQTRLMKSGTSQKSSVGERNIATLVLLPSVFVKTSSDAPVSQKATATIVPIVSTVTVLANVLSLIGRHSIVSSLGLVMEP